MDRRTILAIALIMVVAILRRSCFPIRKRRWADGRTADSGAVMRRILVRFAPEVTTFTAPPSAHPPVRPSAERDSQPERNPGGSSPIVSLPLSTRARELVEATLKSYRSFARVTTAWRSSFPTARNFWRIGSLWQRHSKTFGLDL